MVTKTWFKRFIGLLLSVVSFCQIAAPALARPFDVAEGVPSPSTTSGTDGLAAGEGVSAAGEAPRFSDMVPATE